MRIWFDDNATDVIAKVNKDLTQNGVPYQFEFDEACSDYDGYSECILKKIVETTLDKTVAG